MSKQDNLTDFLTDVADAIRERKGTTEKINPQNFADEIKSLKKSTWTGHADVEGLKAIGWTDEDIAYYQEHGVNWMAEDDEYHKVSDDNKALYGVLTADNIQEYKDRIVYLPKIDTSGKTSMTDFCKDCSQLLAIPMMDTSNVTAMMRMFQNCTNLLCVPPFDTSSVTNMDRMFHTCNMLRIVPPFDTSNVTQCSLMFESCSCIERIPLKFSKLKYIASYFSSCTSLMEIPNLGVERVTNAKSLFYSCRSITRIPNLDISEITNTSQMCLHCYSLRYAGYLDMRNVTVNTDMFTKCYSLTTVYLDNLASSLASIKYSPLLSKESLLYMIEHEAATEAITITLHAAVYARLATDPDIVEALTNHPLVTLASA